MKNWDVTICQVVLLIVGGCYLLGALQSFLGRSVGYQQSFVLTMNVGIILVGLALALYEVRRFRAKKSVGIKIESQA